MELISQQNSSAFDQEVLRLPGMDPLFVLDNWTALSVLPYTDPERLSDHLAHQVSRAPGDLKSHTRRIHFFLNQGHVDGLYGAMLDLFVVLGNKGLDLRKRLLKIASKVLAKTQSQLLLDSLERGIYRFDPLPPTQYSVLCQFFPKGAQLIERRGVQHQDSTLDPLVEAREMIEYGQVEEAKQLLEEAVLDSPLRQDLNEDLLEIYRYTRNADDLFDMLARLGGRTTAIPEQWEAMIDHFDSLSEQKDETP